MSVEEMPRATDGEQVRRFLAAKAEPDRERAFEEFLRRHLNAVYGYCLGEVAGNRQEAEDVVQDTFLIALKDLHKVKDPDAVRGWLRGVARNLARARGKGPGIVPADDIEILAEDGGRREEQAAAEREARASLLVETIVAGAREPHQRMHDLVVRQGLKGAELGRKIGITPAQAARRAHKYQIWITRRFEANLIVLEGRACARLLGLLRDAGYSPGTMVPGDLQSTVTRHVAHCGQCGKERDPSIWAWTPALLPVLPAAGLHDSIMRRVREHLVADIQADAGHGKSRQRPARHATRDRRRRAAVMLTGAGGALVAVLLVISVAAGASSSPRGGAAQPRALASQGPAVFPPDGSPAALPTGTVQPPPPPGQEPRTGPVPPSRPAPAPVTGTPDPTASTGTGTPSTGTPDPTASTGTGTPSTGTPSTPPTLTIPPDQTVEATGPDGATVPFTVSASDAQDRTLTPSCSPVSGSVLPPGTTTVNCSVTDSGGLTATDSFTVTVQDTTPPSLNLPGNITAEATEANGAAVTYTATATDLVDGPVPLVSCSPASGSTFALGTTTVNCSATDSGGLTATDSFTVTVYNTLH